MTRSDGATRYTVFAIGEDNKASWVGFEYGFGADEVRHRAIMFANYGDKFPPSSIVVMEAATEQNVDWAKRATYAVRNVLRDVTDYNNSCSRIDDIGRQIEARCREMLQKSLKQLDAKQPRSAFLWAKELTEDLMEDYSVWVSDSDF